MKRYCSIICFLFFAFTLSVSAQYERTLKYISKGRYEKAYKNVYDDYVDAPEDVELNYSLAVLYSTKGFHGYDLRLAYEYAKRTETFYLNVVADNPRDKRIEKWVKAGITIPNIEAFKKSMAQKALQDAYNSDNPHMLEQYVTLFKDEPEFANEAKRIRDANAFKTAKQINTAESYKEFVENYPDAIQVGEARQQFAKMLFMTAKEKNTIEGWRMFLSECVESVYNKEAKEQLDYLVYQQAIADSNIADLKAYITEFPNGIYIQSVRKLYEQKTYNQSMSGEDVNKHIEYIQQSTDSVYLDKALNRLLDFSMKTNNLQGVIFFVNNYPEHNRYKEAFFWLYNAYTGDGELKSIETFERNFPDTTFSERVAADKVLCAAASDLGFDRPFREKEYRNYKGIIRSLLPRELGFVALQHALEEFLLTKNYRLAAKRVEAYGDLFHPDDSRYTALLEQINRPQNSDFKKISYSFLNNRVKDLQAPLFSPDGESLFFGGRGINGEDTTLNIYVSYWFGEEWQKPVPLKGLNTLEYDEYPCDISEDGLSMVYVSDGDLYMATYDGMQWTSREKLPSPINTPYIETDAYLLPFDEGLLFVSDRPGGFNTNRSGEKYHGDYALATDIYLSLKTKSGWSAPVLLSGNINTRYSERYPSLSPDGKTMYFSSDGRSGLGKTDILECYRLRKDSWTEWTEPVLMGKEINTPYHDLGFKRCRDGMQAYYFTESSYVPGTLYVLPVYGRSDADVFMVEGKLLNEYKDPIEGTVQFVNIENQQDKSQATFENNGKNFMCKLKDSTRYYMQAFNDRGFSLVEEVAAEHIKNAPQTIILYNLEELSMQSRSLNIPNLFDTLVPTRLSKLGEQQLNLVAHVLKNSPYLLTVSVHTERFGETKECYDRSVKQANTIKNHLLEQGVRSEKMIVTGYGDLRPLPGNVKTNRIEFSFAK